LISQDKIEEIKSASDIVDIISGYISVKKSGANYKALCPFHQEKTPSFMISPAKQIFHCFGCHEGGNVFSFVQKIEGMTFVESVQLLAKRTGIELDYAVAPGVKSDKDKIIGANKAALDYFRETLASGGRGAEYAASRGLSKEIIDEFMLGYAPPGDGLFRRLKEKNVDDGIIEAAGLCKRTGPGFTDVFRDRFMFPIFNIYGEPVAFGGRVLDDSLPKYINSKETVVYVKGRNLYNLNNAKKYRAGYIAVVEGYTDAIALYKAGVRNVVATLGTALTQDQARLIKRNADSAVIIYDSDEAGLNGAVRGGDALFGEGVETKVLIIKGAKDPDEFIGKNGKDAMVKSIESAVPFIDFRLERIKASGDINSAYYKETALKEIAAVIAKAESFVVRADAVKKAAMHLALKEDTVAGYLAGFSGKGAEAIEEAPEKGASKERGANLAERSILKAALSAFGIEDEQGVLKHVKYAREHAGIEYEGFYNKVYAKLLKRIEELVLEGGADVQRKLDMEYIEGGEESRVLSGLYTEISAEKRDKEDSVYAEKLMLIIDECLETRRKAMIKAKLDVLGGMIAKAEAEKDEDALLKLITERQETQKILNSRGEDFE